MNLLRNCWLQALMLVICLGGVSRGELIIEHIDWGVDGKLREGRFNLITIHVMNNDPAPFDGALSLQPEAAFQSRDIPLVNPDVYIEPQGRRAIQFIAYVADANEYVIRWGFSPKESFHTDDPPPVAHEPAIIQLVSSVQFDTASVPTFDEGQFPTSVAGFDGVETILLNHAPRWDNVRSRVLKDWIYQGGTLHLFQDGTGKFPEFGPALAELNEPSDEFAVGGGRVVRHKLPISGADRRYLAEKVPRSLTVDTDAANGPNPAQTFQQADAYGSIRSLLKMMTQPNHQWGLIYFLAVLYLLAVFPGCWLVGRKRGDFRIVYLTLVGVIALFSLGFRTVGARGYGERTVINTLAILKPVTEGRVKANLWSNFFVTGGGQFAIQHTAEGGAYGSGQTDEGVLGKAFNRPFSQLAVDIPSFTGRSLVATGVFKVDAPQLEVINATLPGTGGNTRVYLNLRNASDWPPERILRADVLIGDQFYSLTRQGDKYYTSGHGRPITTELNEAQNNSWQYMYRSRWDYQPTPPEQLYAHAWPLLIYQDLGVTDAAQLTSFNMLRKRQLRVFLTTDLPEELHATVSAPVKELGRAIYVIDIPLDADVPEVEQSADPVQQQTDSSTDQETPQGSQTP